MHHCKNIILTIFLSLLLFACGRPGAEPVPHFKVGGPYRIAGKVYKPMVEPSYKETGLSSWYGDKFHMRHTANGEVFHKGDLTAAHRTLPLPSVVRVTNTANGKSVILRVNDRGPFAKSRIIDVSEHAASLLGFKNIGTAIVNVELLPQESFAALTTVKIKPEELAEMKRQYELASADKQTREALARQEQQAELAAKNAKKYSAKTGKSSSGKKQVQTAPAVTATAPQYQKTVKAASVKSVSKPVSQSVIVAGTFSSKQIADSKANSLKKSFSTKIQQIKVDGAKPYRLIIGGIKNSDEARTILNKLKSLGYKNARVE